jgi:hypothetical protein
MPAPGFPLHRGGESSLYNVDSRSFRLALEDELLRQRHERLAQIRALGFDPYGQAFDFSDTIPKILETNGAKSAEELAGKLEVRVAGRILTVRRMGKAGFLHLLQNGEKLQIYVKKDAVSETAYRLYELLDIGDIIGVTGYLFRTKTGELSVHAGGLTFLSKIMLALPEKWHGLEDVETRYRQRYLDLIANSEVRKIFVTRSKIVSSLRRQLDARGGAPIKRLHHRRFHLEEAARVLSRRITMRSISISTCASRRNSISSGWSWEAWSGFTKSTATFATKAFRRATIPSSRCSSSIRRIAITAA